MGTELSPWSRLELVVAEVSVWEGTGTHPRPRGGEEGEDGQRGTHTVCCSDHAMSGSTKASLYCNTHNKYRKATFQLSIYIAVTQRERRHA